MAPSWILLLFVAMWTGVTGLLAHLGGWATLAQRFQSDAPVQGTRFRFASGALGRQSFPVNYSSCLFVKVNTMGLRLSLFLPFRFLSPPLFVPWTAVESVEQKRMLFIRFTTFVLQGTWPRITLNGAAAEAVYQACRAARPDLTYPETPQR